MSAATVMEVENGEEILEMGEEMIANGEETLANGEFHKGHGLTPSDPIAQWKGVIHATIAVNKLKANIRAKVDPASQLEYLMIVHTALVNQFNAFGIVLTLLAAVTSVAILQPPGSFDGGHMSTSSLVACFLMFSSISFLLACTGLLAVIVGSASLFRPWFFPKPPPAGSEAIEKIVTAGQGTKNGVVYDDIPTLAAIILDNLLRVRRLRIYLALSLGLCMVAFVCGAFAILGPKKRNLYMAIGTVIVSSFVLVFETVMTLIGPTHPPKWLRKCARYIRDVGSGRLDGAAMKKTTSGNIRRTMERSHTIERSHR